LIFPPVFIVLAVLLAMPTLKLYDFFRLARFAHQIAQTDRIVTTRVRSSVSLTITGEAARKVVRAVSSAASHRPPFGMATSCSFMEKATFYRGTNVLGDIEICSSLFLIRGAQPPFIENSGVLNATVCKPVRAAYNKEEEAKLESCINAQEGGKAAQ
jgi:hypothetical protein